MSSTRAQTIKHQPAIGSIISIIIPTKNRCDLLRETIDSILDQTYEYWEAVVVDDGSNDGTAEMMNALCASDKRIRFLKRSGSKSGAPVCRNQGFLSSVGEYVIFLDSDDCLAPICLEHRFYTLHTRQDLDFAVFGCQVFRKTIGDTLLLWNVEIDKADDLDRFLALDPPWVTLSPMWKRSSFARLGLWDRSALSFQDWELHIRALLAGFHYIKVSRPDCFYRLSYSERESISSKSYSPDHLRSHEKLIVKIHAQLSQTQRLNADNQMRMASLYFFLAQEWVSHGIVKDAKRIWVECHRSKLIGFITFCEGMMYLYTKYLHNAKRVRFISGLMRRYITARWPRKMVYKSSNTCKNAPMKSS